MLTRGQIITRLASIALIVALGGGSAGCVVGPGYSSPEVRLAPLHAAPAAAARSTTQPEAPLEDWWTGFGDPTLTRIVERVLQDNLDLAAALARVEQARAAARAAGAQLLPAGELAAQVSPLHQSLNSPIGTIAQHLPGYDRNQTLYDVGAAASWEIDLFGGIRRRIESAEADAQAREADRLAVRVTVVAEAGDAYFQARAAQVRLELAHEQVATDEQLLSLVRLRLAAGAASDREVAQAEALLASAQATLPPLHTVLEAQLNRLDVLMGAQPGDHAELTIPANLPTVPAVSADEQLLLRHRPDVIAAERRLAGSSARIGVAVADYYPKVSLAALLGFESLSTPLFTSAAFQPAATAGLRWRLFDFGRVDAEVAQARGAQSQALADYRQSILRAAEDVENSLTRLVQSETQSAVLARDVDALTRARDASEEDYRAGADALTDVLDADRELLAARDDWARSRFDAARAAVSTYRALGGGW